MRVLFIVCIIVGTNSLLFANGKQYMRCELCKELIQKYNFDKTFLSNWICMIEHESGRDTTKVSRKPNGSASYGIFQINSKGWCTIGRKGGICNTKCEDFLNDNITDDVACAKKIYAREGFQHWSGWVRNCKKPENLINLSVICGIDDL
ncbi:lysozyme-like [Episyrphus balteatus]|uniref:lysozyme-like n=1 Tax=Episyrphus balteatus TaxID=286459 RepID=UPI002485FE6E|nr:lysozyme-like [Episyrphus balteatus]XP_055839270.1 lysozyme-like [Episyrphus balteatus]XP_055839271.1 lysozyme-like [Episyrphus balteatus]